MSHNVDDQSDESSRATAPSSSTVKLEQTSPTAGDPAVSTRVMLASPKSTKKAWRQRLEMDAALAAASATLSALPPPVTSSPEVKSTVDVGGGVSLQFVVNSCFSIFFHTRSNNVIAKCISK